MKQNEEKHMNVHQSCSAGNWEAIFKAVHDLIMILDIDNRIIDANPAVFKATGLREDQVIGQFCYKIFHCSEKPPCECPYEKLKKSHLQESCTMEMEALGRKYLVTVAPVFEGDSKQVTKIVHIAKDITTLKEAEAARLDSEKKFQGIFDAASDGILVADIVDKNFVDANWSICEMLGYTREELFKLDVGDIHPQEDLPRVIEVFEKQVKREMVLGTELPVKRKDGTVFYADISSRPVKLGGRQLLIGIFRDATLRIQAEQLLKEEKNKAQKYLDVASVMLVALNTQGEITLINQQGCNVLKVDEEYALGKNWFDYFLPKENAQDVKKVFEQIIAGGLQPVEHYENQVVTQNGELRTIAFHNTILTDEKGFVVGTLSSGEDITDRKQAEKERQKSDALYHDLVETSQDLIWQCDAQRRYTYLNPAWEDVFGYKLTEMLGKKFSDFQTRVYAERDMKEFARLMKGNSVKGLETVHVGKDGREIHLVFNAKFLVDETGKPAGTRGTAYNITERKQAEKDLLKLQKLESVGLLAGGIAHDFNNILSAILGNVNLALVDSQLTPETRKLLYEAEKASFRAKDLTQQLLTFSKGGAPVKEAASLKEVVRDSAEFVLRGEKSVSKFEIPDNLWLADVDKGQISQVVQNIILNANQAMPYGGTIEISFENYTQRESAAPLSLKKGNYIKLKIKDTGVGIPEKLLDKIFDPYFSTKQQGSGLGLAICQSIISKHNGYIFVESAPGEGTTFTIFLPASDGTKIQRKASSGECKPYSPVKILIMDDEEMLRNVAKAMLTKLGNTVVLAADGAEAVKCYQESMNSGNPIQLVIMDLTVPGGMGGKEAVLEIHKLNPEAKVIVSSGYSNDPVMANYKNYGFCAAISKPFQLQDLSQVLTKVLA